MIFDKFFLLYIALNIKSKMAMIDGSNLKVFSFFYRMRSEKNIGKVNNLLFQAFIVFQSKHAQVLTLQCHNLVKQLDKT